MDSNNQLGQLLKSMTTNDTTTANGMAAHSTSANFCVDMFGRMGSMRGELDGRVISLFTKAYGESPLTAMKLLFWVRDIRGGAGERKIFKTLLKELAENHTESISKNIQLITEYGRWDDLLVLLDTKLESKVLTLISDALNDGNGLCAKWMPRQSKAGSFKNIAISKIRKKMKLSPKAYRKLIVSLSNTVEQMMCDGNWDNIDFSKLPSKAMSDYMKTFSKHVPVKWAKYLEDVEAGKTKINAGAVYPYDIVKNVIYGDKSGANVQWNALPNYMEGSNERVLPLVDVSGSMYRPAGGNPLVTCMDVAVSLGVYISERNEGLFKDSFITFSKHPELEVLKGKLSERVHQLSRDKWGMNTNLEAALELILNSAVKGSVPRDEMPTMLMIFSDMQFDEGVTNGDANAMELVKYLYTEAGYVMPKVVFWNLAGRNDNTPVQSNDSNTALVSGFSPALLKTLLSGKDISPYSMMMEVVNSERYAPITV